MKTINDDIEVIPPKVQPHLFGYKAIFDSFIELFEKKEIPNSILFSGAKGSGKSTLVYHLVNYLLSKDEQFKYSVNNNHINEDNLSYKLLNTNTHPNFFLIENNVQEKDIKIDQIRRLLEFLNKSTYSKNLKIVMIDNAEYLNLNSSNALLKAIEEPTNNTFFFIIHNSASEILDTIKSRCTEFRIFFTTNDKKKIFQNLIKYYQKELQIDYVDEYLRFDSPGNLIRYFLILNKENVHLSGDKLTSILYFIKKYEKDKNQETLSFLSFFIALYYNELCLNNINNSSHYIFNQSQIFKKIGDMKKFNLNEKNTLIYIKDILLNDFK